MITLILAILTVLRWAAVILLVIGIAIVAVILTIFNLIVVAIIGGSIAFIVGSIASAIVSIIALVTNLLIPGPTASITALIIGFLLAAIVAVIGGGGVAFIVGFLVGAIGCFAVDFIPLIIITIILGIIGGPTTWIPLVVLSLAFMLLSPIAMGVVGGLVASIAGTLGALSIGTFMATTGLAFETILIPIIAIVGIFLYRIYRMLQYELGV